ncbi:MAG: hypothetical protein ABIL74_10430 [candidate division WOR-3 bacterium]
MGRVIFCVRGMVVIILLLVGISCPRFKRNPNLRLLLKEENYSLLNPRWTRGGWIYYIRCDHEKDGEYGPGEIWRIKDDGQSNELVFPESAINMDISPSETLLAAFTSEPYGMYSPLILYNVKTAEIKTLANGYYPCIGLQFGTADTLVYYSDRYGLYRINLNNNVDTLIISSNIGAFSIYNDSLAYYVHTITPAKEYVVDIINNVILYEFSEFGSLCVSFFPYSSDSIITAWEHSGIFIISISAREKTELDVRPYEVTVWAALGNCIDFNPLDSDQIVFCAARSCQEGFVYGGFELWILEKF